MAKRYAKEKEKKVFDLDRLPDRLPVLPLTGVLLLPKGHLPLHIFESRYLDMVYYAREANGLIGMVQPAVSPLLKDKGDDNRGTAARGRPLYTTGCVGIISDLTENKEGGLIIVLTGLSRYDIVEELPQTQTFREVRVLYDRFQEDCAAPFRAEGIPRQKLVLTMEKYLKLYNVFPKWEMLEKACDEELVNALAMLCPFNAAEKQALIEVVDLQKRADLLLTMMEFDLSDPHDLTVEKYLQ